MKARLLLALVVPVAFVGCQTITEEMPSKPTSVNPVLSIPLPVTHPTVSPTPAPTPTPKPTPTPGATPTPAATPTPTPTPTPSGPTGTCVPTPPPLHHFNIKILNDMGFKKIIDTAPNICDAAYCSQIMNDPTRRCCPIKAEGDPDREFCEGQVVGIADTVRPGPTWSLNGHPCLASDPGGTASRCVNHWDNQYLLVVYGPGLVKTCSSASGICAEIVVP
jgi:hypothetical protein